MLIPSSDGRGTGSSGIVIARRLRSSGNSLVSTRSLAKEAEAKSEEKGNLVILPIPILSNFRFRSRLRLLIYTGT